MVQLLLLCGLNKATQVQRPRGYFFALGPSSKKSRPNRWPEVFLKNFHPTLGRGVVWAIYRRPGGGYGRFTYQVWFWTTLWAPLGSALPWGDYKPSGESHFFEAARQGVRFPRNYLLNLWYITFSFALWELHITQSLHVGGVARIKSPRTTSLQRYPNFFLAADPRGMSSARWACLSMVVGR